MAALFVAAAALSNCGIADLPAYRGETRPPEVAEAIRRLDLQPRTPRGTDQPAVNPGGRTEPTVYLGNDDTAAGPATGAQRGTVVSAATGAEVQVSGDGYDLSFENAPVTTVAKVILGDILGSGYTIDPRIQGTITLASGRPISKADLPSVVESALRMSNVSMVRDATGYRLIPAADAIGSGTVETNKAEAGYGITVIPLRYVSAQTALKLIDGFATKAGAARAEVTRNLILVQGSSIDRRTALDTVTSFDADWMRGQSVGIFPLRNSTPEPVITELEKIMDSGEGGLSQQLVKLQPIARMNAILVVSKKADLLRAAGKWVARLDQSDAATNSLKVYRVRYGNARRIATLLNEIFVGRGDNADSATNQIAPGSGVTATTSMAGGFGTSSSSGTARTSGGLGSSGLSSGGLGSGSSGGFGSGFSQSGTSSGVMTGGTGSQSGLRIAGGTDPNVIDPASGMLGSNSGAASSFRGAGGLLPGVRITADVTNNSVLVYASQDQYRIIEQTIQQIDRPQQQVAIEGTIAEVTLNDQLNYGVQFYLTSSNLGLGPDHGSMVKTVSSAANSATGALIDRALPGFNLLLGHEASPRMILDALHRVTDIKVLSNPTLVVLDNQLAILQVGDQVPVSTGTATVLTGTANNVVNSIDYRNTGVILRVIPRISHNGTVVLDIEQEISNVAQTDTANTLTPTVSQRRVKSSISVASGQTVVLAGLISDSSDKWKEGVPVLDAIPGLGDAFQSQRVKKTRTELIIFIRPQIIRDSVDAHVVAEELRAKIGGRVVGDWFPDAVR